MTFICAINNKKFQATRQQMVSTCLALIQSVSGIQVQLLLEQCLSGMSKVLRPFFGISLLTAGPLGRLLKMTFKTESSSSGVSPHEDLYLELRK